MIIRWYLFIRQPKRLVSFRRWLFNKWVSNKYSSSNNSKQLGKNIALNPNSYLWRIFFGSADLYFSRNYGLDYNLGYFTFLDSTEANSINFGKFFSLSVKKNIALLFKLCSLSSIRDFWSSSIVYNLNNFLYSTRKKRFLFGNKFFERSFSKNFFMRKLWYGRFSALRLFKTRNIKSYSWFKEDFLYSKFNFRFLKYLFFVRFSKNLVAGHSSILSHLHLNILSSTFAPKYQGNIAKDIRSNPTHNLINLQRKDFFSSLFAGWSTRTFVYTPKPVNKDILKIFYLIRKFGYPYLNKYKSRFFKYIPRRKQGNLFNKIKLNLFKSKKKLVQDPKKNLEMMYSKQLKRFSNLKIKSISIAHWTKFLLFYNSYLVLEDKSLSLMRFKNIPYLKIFSKMSNSFIQGPPIKPKNASLKDMQITKLWTWNKGFAKKDLSLAHIVNNNFKKMLSVVLKLLKKFLVIKSINSKFNTFFTDKFITKLFSKQFYIFFNNTKNINIFRNKSKIKKFYFTFFNFFTNYIYVITKDKSLLKLNIFNSKEIKKDLNKRVDLFKSLWFNVSKGKLFYLFKYLRNHLLDYSLVNISLTQNSVLNLYFNTLYDKKLFMWFYFLQSSIIKNSNKSFIKADKKKTLSGFYKTFNNKNLLILS